jgi:uncharacterized protein (TIGR02679 family)
VVTFNMETSELLRFLGRPELRRLWTAARSRMEHLGGPRGTVLLTGVGEDERRAVADLLGLPTVPTGALRIRLDRIDRVLQESRFAVDLRTALELLDGPLRDRAAERTEEKYSRQKLWEDAARHPVIAARPVLQQWLDGLRAGGLLRRLAGRGNERLLLDQALAVLAALSGPMRLPVLASQVLGDSHALDAGRPVATLVLRALAREADLPPPENAAERRKLWEQAGVVADDLSCQVLVLGLAPVEGGPIRESLRALAAAGEPARITLRQLLNFQMGDLAFPPGLEIRICENPVILAAAADRWGPACPPLVCLEGFPSYAAQTLLTRLASQGAAFHYHGDFDWDGLRIANKLREIVPFHPWRFTATDYKAALATGGERPPLHSRRVEASWDAELGPALSEVGLAVEEETVLEDLLADLAVSLTVSPLSRPVNGSTAANSR